VSGPPWPGKGTIKRAIAVKKKIVDEDCGAL
jgi:hypothetical protein